MNKLILHIGYPKTATTTLQNGLFLNLHQNGHINYLGRSKYSKTTQFKQANIFSRSLFKNNTLEENDIALSSELVNLISEETLTFPTFYKEKQFKRQLANSFEFPGKINEKLKQFTSDIQIVVTLRSQQDLIYSLYATKYGAFSKDQHNDNPQKHIFDINNKIKKELFSIYDFSELLKKYAEFFGKDNVGILLFEDFKYDKEYYINELSKCLNIDKSIINSNFSEVHYRKSKKTDSGTIVHFREKRLLGKAIKKFEKYIFYKNRFNRLEDFYEKNKTVSKLKKRLTINKNCVIPKLTNEQKNIILNEFKESNIKLASEFGLDKEKLQKYNYI